MAAVDLNADLGESHGVYRLGDDESLLAAVSSANIACGFHAGDPRVMDRTVQVAVERGVAVGAHVGYPDLVGFGRRPMQLAPHEIETDVLYQIGALFGFCKKHGASLQHVKPHGALYNQAVDDPAIARAIARAAASFGRHLILVALPNSALAAAGRELGLRVALEGYADRNVSADGRLLPRSEPGAILTDPEAVAQRALQMVQTGTVTAADGTVIPMPVQTLCLHGDNPNALALAAAVRNALEQAGATITPLSRQAWKGF